MKQKVGRRFKQAYRVDKNRATSFSHYYYFFSLLHKTDIHIVTCPLKSRVAEPEETPVARVRLGKYASAVTDTHPTKEELLEAVFSMRSVQRLYTGDET
jgi:hypothetical protein